jgi:YHS domain-containing protein
MFVTMVVAALVVDGVFSAVGFVPTGARPTRTDVFSMLAINYKLVLNVAAGLAFTLLFGLTVRRGATDPVCGMKVDRAKALTERHAGRTYVFCSDHCRRRFIAARAGGRKTTPAAIASLRSPHPSAGGSQSNGRRGGTADDGGDRRRLRRLSHRGTL